VVFGVGVGLRSKELRRKNTTTLQLTGCAVPREKDKGRPEERGPVGRFKGQKKSFAGEDWKAGNEKKQKDAAPGIRKAEGPRRANQERETTNE